MKFSHSLRISLCFTAVCAFERSVPFYSVGYNTSGCHCDTSKVVIHENEVVVTNSAGGGCIGGCGGEGFGLQCHDKKLGVVQSLTVWHGTSHEDKNNGLKALRIKYFDGISPVSVGDPSSAEGFETIEFKPGETIIGDVILSGNGFGTRVGYMKFETSAGQKFEVGQDDHHKYLFSSGNSFISGFGGRAGSDIDQLYVIFWKPVKSIRVKDISYPSLDSMTKTKSPTVLAQQDYCNDNAEERAFQGRTIVKEELQGSDACYKFGFSENYGAKLEMSASLPELVSLKGEAHWDVGATQNFDNCEKKSTKTTVTLSFPSPTIKAHTRTSYRYTQWQGKLSALPFTATMMITFVDGSTVFREEKGEYKGTDYCTVQQTWTHEEHDVEACGLDFNASHPVQGPIIV